MVQCEFCLNYNGIECLEVRGAKFGEIIEDSLEHIECGYYLEKGVAGLMGMGWF